MTYMLNGLKVDLKMNFKKSDKQVKDLLNGEEVVVLSGGFAYNTLVEWTLADFMDNVPPFVEVNFNERCEAETIYYTSDLETPLYEFNSLFFVLDKD